jgi:hypothetical protein
MLNMEGNGRISHQLACADHSDVCGSSAVGTFDAGHVAKTQLTAVQCELYFAEHGAELCEVV